MERIIRSLQVEKTRTQEPYSNFFSWKDNGGVLICSSDQRFVFIDKDKNVSKSNYRFFDRLQRMSNNEKERNLNFYAQSVHIWNEKYALLFAEKTEGKDYSMQEESGWFLVDQDNNYKFQLVNEIDKQLKDFLIDKVYVINNNNILITNSSSERSRSSYISYWIKIKDKNFEIKKLPYITTYAKSLHHDYVILSCNVYDEHGIWKNWSALYKIEDRSFIFDISNNWLENSVNFENNNALLVDEKYKLLHLSMSESKPKITALPFRGMSLIYYNADTYLAIDNINSNGETSYFVDQTGKYEKTKKLIYQAFEWRQQNTIYVSVKTPNYNNTLEVQGYLISGKDQTWKALDFLDKPFIHWGMRYFQGFADYFAIRTLFQVPGFTTMFLFDKDGRVNYFESPSLKFLGRLGKNNAIVSDFNLFYQNTSVVSYFFDIYIHEAKINSRH